MKTLPALKRSRENPDQSGINMVDLMMWLVIAALILAAAIQGIGYYQKAAYLYQIKNDVMGGATKVLSLSGMEHNGKVDEQVVAEGLLITQTTEEVVLTAGTAPDGKPIIRGTHPALPGKEVVYFFYPYGNYQSGNTTIAEPGEYLPTAAPRGDVDGDGIRNEVDPDIDGDGTLNEDDTTPNGAYSENLSEDGRGDGVSAVTIGTRTADGSESYNDTHDWGHLHGATMQNTLPAGQLDFTGFTYNPDNRRVMLWVKTDGTFGGTGGSWSWHVHTDIKCWSESQQRYHYNSKVVRGMLSGPYFNSNPGPNENGADIDCGINAPGDAIPQYVVARTALAGETGEAYYERTLPDFMEAWSKSFPIK